QRDDVLPVLKSLMVRTGRLLCCQVIPGSCRNPQCRNDTRTLLQTRTAVTEIPFEEGKLRKIVDRSDLDIGVLVGERENAVKVASSGRGVAGPKCHKCKVCLCPDGVLECVCRFCRLESRFSQSSGATQVSSNQLGRGFNGIETSTGNQSGTLPKKPTGNFQMTIGIDTAAAKTLGAC